MPKVIVYSTPTCPYCYTLKAYLDDNKIPYDDIDVAADEKAREEMVKKTGQMGVPVTDIDGQAIIGFDRHKISELLNIKD